jgi:uncharacterized membrane protein SirB2
MPDNLTLFTTLKIVHMITITLTISGFILRGVWMIRESPLLNATAVRVLPHINDTLLLISAVWAAAAIGQYPFVDPWLTAKVLGALAYILLGAVALNYGRTRKIRIRAFIAALVCFAYVVMVAATKNPLVF